MSQEILLVSGWAGSGKDTLAEYLEDKCDFARIAFADPLKQLVSRKYRISPSILHTPEQKDMPLTEYPVVIENHYQQAVVDQVGSSLHTGYWTPRALCILEGMIGRLVSPNLWVQAVADQIQYHSASIVIPDWRYPNEFLYLKRMVDIPIRTVRIVREGLTTNTNDSEHALDNFAFDVTLNNEGTINEFTKQAYSVLFPSHRITNCS